MQRTEIKSLFSAVADYIDSEVTVCGWVKTIRQSKTLGFIELNDGTSFQNLIDEAKGFSEDPRTSRWFLNPLW